MVRKRKRGRPEGLSARTQQILSKIESLGVISFSQAMKLGFSKPALSRLSASGQILRVRKGFYIHPESKIEPKYYDFVVACTYFGRKSTIGGLSALFYHGLIEQVPKKIWVVVPHGQKTTNPLYRLMRTQTNPTIGVEDHDLFRITNLERTLLDGLCFASKIGPRVAIRATRQAISEGRTTEAKLGRQATALDLRRVIEKYWDSIEV